MSQHFPPHGVYGNHNASPNLHPAAKAVRAVLVGCLIAVPITTVLAVSEAHAQQSVVRSFVIAPSALGTALSNFAAAADITLSFDANQTRGKQSAGLTGQYSVEAGLRALLVGSGLQAVHLQNGNYVLRESVEGQSVVDDTVLPAVTVAAKQIGDLPTAYIGGQVARGGSLGMLGNTDFMDTPFNQTSYTSALIENQQASTVGELLRQNDPSVRSIGESTQSIQVRGFDLGESGFLTLNGLPGIVAQYISATEFIERVEVLKGPNAALNGMSPTGGVGGSINVVTKRAGDKPLTRLTASYAEKSRLGIHADVGRRFGENKEWGVRFNGAWSDGNTARKNQEVTSKLGTLGLDYRGANLRASLDVIRQDVKKTGARGELVYFSDASGVPRAPNGKSNFDVPWSVMDNQSETVATRVEYDFSKDLTGYVAVGKSNSKLNGFAPRAIALTNAAGDYSFGIFDTIFDMETVSAEAGLRGNFETGLIKHKWALNVSQLSRKFNRGFGDTGVTGGSNIYSPNPGVAEPSRIANLRAGKVNDLDLDSVGITDTMSFLGDKLLLTVGARHQRIESTNFNPVTDAQTDSYQKSATTPIVAIVFKPTERVSVYGNYVEGLTPGDVAGSPASNEGAALAPYVSKQREVGVKYDFGPFAATLSAFEITKPSAGIGPSNIFEVNGEQRNRGLEINVFGEVVRGFRLLGGVTYIDAKLSKTSDGINEGNRAVGVSKIGANIGGEWDIAGIPGLTLTGLVIHTGDAYANATNTLRTPSWTRTDLGARYITKAGQYPVTLRAGLENAFDRGYWSLNGPFGAAELARPRTFRLSMTVDF